MVRLRATFAVKTVAPSSPAMHADSFGLHELPFSWNQTDWFRASLGIEM